MTTSAQVAAIIEKRVSMIVTETLEQESVSMGVVKNYSSEVGPGMDRLDIPLFGLLSVQSVNETTGLTAGDSGVTVAQLDLDQHKGTAWFLSDRANIQMKVSVIDANVKNSARSLAAEVDDFIYAAMVVAKGGASLEVDASDPIAAIAAAGKRMDEGFIPKSGRFLTAGPGFMAFLKSDSNVINAEKYGNSNAIQAGFVTTLFGFTIVESASSAVPADGFIANHSDAYAFARQINPSLSSQIQTLLVRTDYAMTHLYGGIANDSGSERIIIAEDLA